MKQKKIDKRILQLALLFAEVHIGDRDILGEARRELYQKIKTTYPNITIPEELTK